MYTYNVTFRH